MTRQLKTSIDSLDSDEFDVYTAIGGIRGIAESVIPGLVFLLVFISTHQIKLTIGVSVVVAFVQLVLRLFQRQSWLGAFAGIVSVGICLAWVWISKDARSYYLPGFIINVVWIVVFAISLVCKMPAVGLIVEYVRKPIVSNFRGWLRKWRSDEKLYRAYWIVTLLWLCMFIARLIVQLPFYVYHQVAWLGTMRLVMGLPLFALVMWLSWLIVAQPYHTYHQHAVRDEE